MYSHREFCDGPLMHQDIPAGDIFLAYMLLLDIIDGG
jgi:hypothetical protein